MFRVYLIIAAFLSACAAAPSQRPEPGVIANSTAEWRGIEYATAVRWDLPDLNPDWAEAEFAEYGSACPQAGQKIMVEDCLFLNIFAPENAAKDLPVLVWFHGGGFRAGEGGDGPKGLVRDDVVVVTFNYRLGKLGFHDWLGWHPDDPRNFGQADMVAALEWIQANIAQFGGDPKNVTLAGHSAGGMGVQLMMIDPRAKGKFARAWAHAGYAAWPHPKAANLSDAQRQLIKYGTLETTKSAEALVADVPYYHLPYSDAPFLRQQPAAIFATGQHADVAYVSGANSYDGSGTLQGAGFTPDAFLARIDGPDLRTAYADDFAVSDLQAAQRIFGDMRYLMSSFATASATNGWAFYFDERQNGAPGAGHGQQYNRIFDAENFAMREALLRLVKTGDPGWAKLERGDVAIFSPNFETRNIEEFAEKRAALQNALNRMTP